MKRLSDLIERLSNIILIILMILLTISTAAQVFSRFIIKSPLMWTEEVSRMTFIWIALLGSSIATKHNQHLGLDIILCKLSPIPKAFLKLVLQGVMMSVAILFITAGWDFVLKNSTRVSETTGYPMYLLYIAAPITGALMLFYLIEQIPGMWREINSTFTHHSERGM